ncbi:helix-turn-helix domain-containing protein [Niallia oryzisoli]|uniref:Helix-turn-helix domain-containing protein n=1 Tax=Niallia oryzisoli TaxID=1737571 RepID=A0ABZ2CBN2_9BACI
MIGRNIYLLRKEKGITLSELAERANVAKSYLSNIERSINKNPSVQFVEKIAQVLCVDVKTIIDGEKVESEKIDKEWIDLITQMKKSGIKKEHIQEYKTLIEFIKWKNDQTDETKTCCLEGKHEYTN